MMDRAGRLPERDDLCMSAGIAVDLTAVMTPPDYLASQHRHSPNGHILMKGRESCFFEREAHPFSIIHNKKEV
ncbi:hypothetical protein PLCT2_02319 [Planctomycetaceae bacterium]|nr:hypothetical protein PLCT2_02319 [Planctomycetaceae bacterium]